MNVEAFREIIRATETAKDEEFDIRSWRAPAGGCGTTACSIGHYAMTDHAKQNGFILDYDDGCYWPAWRGSYEIPAVAMYLDISSRDTRFLFAHPSRTRQQQIAVMREYLASYLREQGSASPAPS